MTAGARFRFYGLKAALVAAVSVSLSVGTPAAAQGQGSDPGKCILVLNKSAAKLAKAQGRQVAKCFKDATAGGLAAASLQSCVSDPGSKVTKAIQKLIVQETKRCSDAPSFGYSGSATTSSVVINQELAAVEDLFGDDLQMALIAAAADVDGARCQAAIAKRYARVSLEAVRAFNACKKAGLGDGSIDSAASLAACLSAASADGKGKIAKARAKLGKDYSRRCEQALDDATAPFPGDCRSAPDALACMSEHMLCRACLELRGVDNITLDCEAFDNGAADASCIDPDADECAGESGGHNCHPDATCTDETDGFSCECSDGYEGDGVHCADIDECAEEVGACDPNATCTNNVGGFDCECVLGFTGDGLVCVDIDECAAGTDNCAVDRTCSNTTGGFICTCDPGFEGDGVSCTDIDECASATDDCDPNATCTNTIGGFSCACDPGFTGDGASCVDIDECGAGSHDCDANAVCTNVPGSFTCVCGPGWQGDGVTCTDIDECATGTDDCDANASCTNLPGSVDCTCNSGYGGDGTICVDDDECIGEGTGNDCSVGADCTNVPGTFTCECPKGDFGDPFGAVCAPIQVALTSPAHGIFTQAGSIGVTGQVAVDDTNDVALTVNGAPVAVQPNGSFTTSIALDPAIIFNEVRAVLTYAPTGYVTRDRRVVIVGPTVPFGGVVPQSVGLRINDTGFDSLEPILTSLVDLDLATLIPPGTKLLDNYCFVDSIFGCLTRGDVTVTAASLASFGIDIDSQTNHLDGTIGVSSLDVDLEVDTNTIDCDMEVTASTATIVGDYTLEPDPVDATVIDVDQPNDVNVGFSNFNHDFTSGFCDFIEGLLNLIIGDIQQQVEDGFVDFMRDPDGGGPQDGVIAQAIEDALAEVELTGPIGEGFGVNLDTPLFAIPEDGLGVTLASGAIMSTLSPAAGAPTFSETLHIPQSYPFSEISTGVTPIGGVAYDMSIGIAESGFNQILAALVESGSLAAEISELDLTGSGDPLPLTAGLFAFLVPEFSQLDSATPLTLRITPTLAPVLTGQSGPNGEIADLIISHLLIDIVSGSPGSELLHGRVALDAAAAFDLTIQGGELVPEITAPDPSDVLITLLDNPLCIDESQLQVTLPALIGPLVPQLAGAFGAFPLPTFLGLEPTALEVSRVGEFLGVFLSVVPAP